MEDIAGLPSPALDVRDLRLVLVLASAGSTARAAALLRLTQPAVSRALASAEERLGARLFERTGRGLTPTAAGQTLASGARSILGGLSDLELRLRAPAPKLRRLRLVCECYTAYHWLPSALVRLRESLPGLEVSLRHEHTDGPVEALLEGHVDVALLTTGVVPHGTLVERKLFSDEIVFLVARDHPLARKKALAPSDLKQHPLLTSRVPAAEASWFLRKVFGRARPRLSFELLPLTEAIVDMARATPGIAILSEWIATPHLGKGDLVVKRLASGPLVRPWRIAWRPDLGEAPTRLRTALLASVPRRR